MDGWYQWYGLNGLERNGTGRIAMSSCYAAGLFADLSVSIFAVVNI